MTKAEQAARGPLPVAPAIIYSLRKRPPAVFACGATLLLAAAVMAAWVVVGWLHLPQFNSAADRLFSTSAFADDDYAVAFVEYSYGGAILLASALSTATAILGFGVLGAWRGVRAWSLVIGAAVVAFGAKFLILGYISTIEVAHIVVSDRLWRQSKMQFDHLTPWRFTPWFHAFSVDGGILVIVTVVGSWTLLSLRASRRFYGDNPRQRA
jgi:hypothetical protein